MPHNEQSYQHTADWRERHCRTAEKLMRVNNTANYTAQAVAGRWCYKLFFLSFNHKIKLK